MLTDNNTEHQTRPSAGHLPGLLKQKGIQRYGLFFVNEEGLLPDGTDATSGYVIASDRRIHFFWVGWDAQRSAPAFTRWSKVQHDPEWDDDQEYYAACKTAGIGPD
jgi:hypothetical protein